MNDEYHQTNSQLDHQATPKRESGDGPGQEGSEYVDPSQGEYDLAGELIKVRKVTNSVLLWFLLISKIDRDMRPPAKLSYRSAIHKKVVFGSGDAWTLLQIQGEVGGDQEPPGNTSRYPMGSKNFLLTLNHI